MLARTSVGFVLVDAGFRAKLPRTALPDHKVADAERNKLCQQDRGTWLWSSIVCSRSCHVRDFFCGKPGHNMTPAVSYETCRVLPTSTSFETNSRASLQGCFCFQRLVMPCKASPPPQRTSAPDKWGRTQMGSDGFHRIVLFQACRGTPCTSEKT